jgi:hypothetical protein
VLDPVETIVFRPIGILDPIVRGSVPWALAAHL